jgi:hypothetical protein
VVAVVMVAAVVVVVVVVVVGSSRDRCWWWQRQRWWKWRPIQGAVIDQSISPLPLSSSRSRSPTFVSTPSSPSSLDAQTVGVDLLAPDDDGLTPLEHAPRGSPSRQLLWALRLEAGGDARGKPEEAKPSPEPISPPQDLYAPDSGYAVGLGYLDLR